MHTRKLVRTGSLVMALAAACVAGTAAAAPGVGPPQDSASGSVRRLLHGPNGELDGLLLSDGTIVTVPPHVGERLERLAPEGSRVEAIGRVEQDASGGNVISARVIVVTPRTGSTEATPPPAAPPPNNALRPYRHDMLPPPAAQPDRDTEPPIPSLPDELPGEEPQPHDAPLSPP